ncbi:hypothetical protein IWW34DRAFT_637840 [Fusarium oxysporum f. sp. albedinis]|nr:hypothetical protein IWW34DRAFT_637840 [Fusarium oxysporum f. sp. albedinis]
MLILEQHYQEYQTPQQHNENLVDLYHQALAAHDFKCWRVIGNGDTCMICFDHALRQALWETQMQELKTAS